MQNSSNVNQTKSRKPYVKPSYTRMPAEQARAFLLERANQGQQEAKEMLELMFPSVKGSKVRAKKTAGQP